MPDGNVAEAIAAPERTPEDEPNGGERRLARWEPLAGIGVAAIAVAAVGRLWLPPAASSLWLDETGTVWLLQGSFTESLSHALDYQGGSPLYYVLLWPLRALFGTGELVLRLPSLVAMGVAAFLLYRLGRRLFDPGAGALAAAVFVALPVIAFAAGDARPYALAMATMIASALALVRWLEGGARRDAIVYAITFAATIYLHYLFALGLLAQGLLLLFRLGRRTSVTGKQLAYLYGWTAALTIPAVPILLRVASQRGTLSNPYPQTSQEILGNLLPDTLAVLLLAGLAFGCLIWPPRVKGWNADDGGLPFVIAWFALPFGVLVMVSEMTTTDLMVPRYFLSVVPALALLAGVAVRRIGSAWAQLGLVAVFGLYAMTRFYSPVHTLEDWRAAAELERSIVTETDTPVLLFSGFIEAKEASWLRDPEKASYLSAPDAAYPLEGRPIYPLPFGLEEETATYLEEIAVELESSTRFVLVTRGSDNHNVWFADRLAGAGFTAAERGNFGGQIRVFEFTRSPTT